MEKEKITPTTEFLCGAKDSTPIAIGYFSVSFTFGIMAAKAGISPWMAGLISLVNVTSAGQFAGLQLIVAGTTYIEMFLTQLVINLRYALMSLSLTQKLHQDCHTGKRLVMAYGVTDEIFAVSVSRDRPVTFSYMMGLILPSVLGWTLGTIAGGIANNLLPTSVQSALGLALYAMFVAIVTAPWIPAFSTIAASFSWNFAFKTECSIPALSSILSRSSDTSMVMVPTRTGCPFA
jgi:predicted branched-subunit amino acid permease